MNRVFYQLILNKTAQALTVATSLLLTIQPAAIKAQEATGQVPTLSSTTTTSSSEAVNLGTAESDYTLGAGDQIRLDIFQVAEYSGNYPVLVDGTISLPLVGNLNVDGLTLKEASAVVSKKYEIYLKRPLVTVGLLAPRPLKIGISGEVDNPGSYEIALVPEAPNFPTVTDIIEDAGGITTIADVRNVRVTRTVQGRTVNYSSDLWSLLTQGQITQDISLRDGDTIFIPTVDEINPAELSRLSEASFGLQTDEPIQVAVTGEINRPGSHTITPEQIGGGNRTDGQAAGSLPPRLSQAVQAANGLKPLANVREVEVRRRAWDGTEKLIAVDLWEIIKSGDLDKDLILQDGDAVIIPQADPASITASESLADDVFRSDITVNVVGEVNSPGAQIVRPGTPLNQAILAAGGFNTQRADKGEVELVRLNPDGTVNKRQIEVDFAQGVNEEGNPTLRNQDVVVVNPSGFTKTTDGVSKAVTPLGGVVGLLRLFIGF